MDAQALQEVRRDDDGELCGYVAPDEGRWLSMTVFRGVLGEFDDEHAARRDVESRGLAALAERWMLVDHESGDEQIVCIQQASPDEVTLALDYYSLPGVPTRTIGVADLAGERWSLLLS